MQRMCYNTPNKISALAMLSASQSATPEVSPMLPQYTPDPKKDWFWIAKYTPARIATFWSKVDMSGGPDACWPFIGIRNKFGYGFFSCGRWGLMLAHRAAYEIAYGEFSGSDRHACHTCDNPPCCNPVHLWNGSHQDNMQDKERKGRGRRRVW